MNHLFYLEILQLASVSNEIDDLINVLLDEQLDLLFVLLILDVYLDETNLSMMTMNIFGSKINNNAFYILSMRTLRIVIN